MAADAHKNFASSLVATAPSPATSGTSLVVTTGDGTKFPAAPFNATIWPANSNPTTATAEIVRVTAVSTDTLTITRIQESTSARTVIVGDQIVAGITAKTLTDVEATAQIFSGFYGDGSDGNVTISTTVTLTRDMFYDTLTINSPGILKTGCFRVFCKTAVVIGAGGVFQNDGPSASGASGGSAAASGTVGTGQNGKTGTTAAGTAFGTGSNLIGGGGGSGGAGTSGAGGAPGAAGTLPAATAGALRSMPQAATGQLSGSGGIITPLGGNSGGSGAGDGTNAGGGSGAAGGILILNARTVTNSGTISANGGNGGTPAAGNCGGGGGGGGGFVIVNTSQAITGSTPTANGGTGGAKTGTGVAGSSGTAGTVLVNVWS